MEEIEAKFLDVDVEDLREKLKSLGAHLVGSYDYRRKLFDYPDYRLDNTHAWIRLRDEGEHVTLTYKERLGAGEGQFGDLGMKEIEVIVSDFDQTESFLKAIGLIEKRYEENRRERWVWDGIVFDIDTWPLIPTYLEIEGSSWEAVEKAAFALGLSWETHMRSSANQVFKKYGLDNHDYSVITFDQQIKKIP
jgi:adenylate cyclase class 2